MRSLGRRLERLKEGDQGRARAQLVALICAHSDEEIAAAFSDPYCPPAAIDRGCQEALLWAAGAQEPAKMKRVSWRSSWGRWARARRAYASAWTA